QRWSKFTQKAVQQKYPQALQVADGTAAVTFSTFCSVTQSTIGTVAENGYNAELRFKFENLSP
ncbi:hypothetical protein CHU98_g6176, partial [Xylaria longipes]